MERQQPCAQEFVCVLRQFFADDGDDGDDDDDGEMVMLMMMTKVSLSRGCHP